MNIDTLVIENLVKKVISEIDGNESHEKPEKEGKLGIFNDVEHAIDATYIAQKKFMQQSMAH